MSWRSDVTINISLCKSMFFLSFGLKKVVLICLQFSSLVLVAIVYSRSKYQNTNRLIGLVRVSLSLTYLPTGVFHWYSLGRSCPSVLRNWQSRSHHVSQQPGQINIVVRKEKMSVPSDPTFSSTLVIFNWHLLLTFENVPHLSLIVRPYALSSEVQVCAHMCVFVKWRQWIWGQRFEVTKLKSNEK